MSEEILFEGEEQPHLLLVDDDATFTRVMARAMTRRGLRVSVAGSAACTRHVPCIASRNAAHEAAPR